MVPLERNRPTDVILSADLLAQVVLAGGEPVHWLNGACFLTRRGGRTHGFHCARTDLVSSVAEHLTTRKDLTAKVLVGRGVQTVSTWAYPANGLAAATGQHMAEAPLVVKPARGSRSRGVSVGIRTPAELSEAWAHALAVDPEYVVVQPQVSGEELRVLVVAGRVIAAAVKRPPVILGDGERNVAELIAALDRRRAANRHLARHPLAFDEVRAQRLADQGFDLTTVLPHGHRVALDESAALSRGGTSHDVTDSVSEAHRALALEVVACFPGLGVAGIDLMTDDIRSGVDATVLEVNSMPGLGLHHYPFEGTARQVATDVVAATFAQPHRTPSGR